jgi:glucosamine kinase
MSQDAECVLGVDAGGTKTLVAIADRNGAVAYSCQESTLDPTSGPAWIITIERVARATGPFVDQTKSAVFGLPFHGEIDALSQEQAAVCGRLFAMRHEVVNDVQLAFDGAFAGGAGVLLLAGTGSMAWAGDGNGLQARVGGWGDAFGDEGSAYWVGREALAEVSRALDGRSRSSEFASLLLKKLGVAETDLIGWCHAHSDRRSKIAGVAKLVDDLAVAGDTTATTLLERAADELADHASAALERSGLRNEAHWSYAGGLFSSRIIRDRVAARMRRPPIPPRLSPVGGALLRAARMSGWTVDDSWINRLSNSLASVLR